MIVKTLKIMKLVPKEKSEELQFNDPAAKLSIIMDNCAGQNKNWMVIRLALYFVEMWYFNEVEFLFLVAGHTKNQCDRMFNKLKTQYNKSNIFSMRKRQEVLTDSNVDVQRIQEGEFMNWDEYLNTLYSTMPVGMTSKNHIFSVKKNIDMQTTSWKCKSKHMTDKKAHFM
jgi:hypothetical protein